MTLPDKLSFYLTQRLSVRQPPTGRDGFDRYFACDYMGSAEFEWGALPESLARIRAAKKIGIHQGLVTRKGITVPVFVVGDIKSIPAIPGALTTWMEDDYPKGKEMTYFPEVVDGTQMDWQRRTDAWWALGSDVMWALNIDVADLLLKAVVTR